MTHFYVIVQKFMTSYMPKPFVRRNPTIKSSPHVIICHFCFPNFPYLLVYTIFYTQWGQNRLVKPNGPWSRKWKRPTYQSQASAMFSRMFSFPSYKLMYLQCHTFRVLLLEEVKSETLEMAIYRVLLSLPKKVHLLYLVLHIQIFKRPPQSHFFPLTC